MFILILFGRKDLDCGGKSLEFIPEVLEVPPRGIGRGTWGVSSGVCGVCLDGVGFDPEGRQETGGTPPPQEGVCNYFDCVFNLFFFVIFNKKILKIFFGEKFERKKMGKMEKTF